MHRSCAFFCGAARFHIFALLGGLSSFIVLRGLFQDGKYALADIEVASSYGSRGLQVHWVQWQSQQEFGGTTI